VRQWCACGFRYKTKGYEGGHKRGTGRRCVSICAWLGRGRDRFVCRHCLTQHTGLDTLLYLEGQGHGETGGGGAAAERGEGGEHGDTHACLYIVRQGVWVLVRR